jgi:ATP-binding cassette subfamily B protein
MSMPTSHSLVKVLRSVHDFAALDDAALLKVVGASANLAFAPGSRVFEAGSASEGLYIILSGRIRIFDGHEARSGDVATLGPGDSFGEISLLRRINHTKSAEAVDNSELMVVPRDSFEELLATNEHVRTHFEKRIAQREALRGEVSDAP